MKKMNLLGKQVSALAAWVTMSAGFAFGYPMSGIDTTLQLEPTANVSLVDKDRRDLVLENGHRYRLRFSNASKSFHIMGGGDHKQEFKVQGGFPRGDLKNFRLDGEKYGNRGIDLLGETRDVLGRTYQSTRSDRCSWTCDYRRVCRDVPRQVCHTDPRTGQRICRTVYERQCHNEPVTCYGTETYEVEISSYDRTFETILMDSINRTRLGKFSGIVDSWTREYRGRLIHSSCPYRY